VPARNSQSPHTSKLLVAPQNCWGRVKSIVVRIRPGGSREDRPKRNPTSSKSGSRRHLSVCLGRGDVGYIDQVGRTYTATALDGRSLDVFADLKSVERAAALTASAAQRHPELKS
jgi:hypothetical protein